MQLIYQDHNSTTEKEISFDVEDKYTNIIQKQILLLRDAENDRGLQKLLTINLRPDLCRLCFSNRSFYSNSSEQLCVSCFEQQYGEIIIDKWGAEYYGGHKAHLAGGLFTKGEYGSLCLTQKYVLFVHHDKNPSKMWEIKIPLSSVMIYKWHIEEESRRKQVAAGGSSLENIGLGAGVIHETGKAHHVVIPYVDENGIPQEPRFGISSFQGKAIREWVSEFYDQVAKVNNEKSQIALDNTKHQVAIHMPIISIPKISQNKDIDIASNLSRINTPNSIIHESNDGQEIISSSKPISVTHQPVGSHDLSNSNEFTASQKTISEPKQVNEDDTSKDNDVGEFVKILKMRLVKGEITKEEFIELRQLVEN